MYLDRFPNYSVEPGAIYEARGTRKVFGEQRYGVISVNKFSPAVKHDWGTWEEAEKQANTATLLGRILSAMRNKPGYIKSVYIQLYGEKPDPGLSIRTLTGRLIHDYTPEELSRYFIKNV